MNLYRLDPAEPTDPLWRRLSDSSGNEWGTGTAGALTAAKRRAKRLDCVVSVSRIDGRTHGVKVVRLVGPSGHVERV